MGISDSLEPLANALLARGCEKLNRPDLHFTPEALQAMHSYSWPGNVREMINKVKRATIMAEGKRVTATDLELCDDNEPADNQLNLRQVRETAERNAILQALKTTGFNMAQASRLLGINRPKL